MTATVGTSTNTNTVALMTGPIVLNDVAAVKVLDARAAGDPPWISVYVVNVSAQDAWVRPLDAATTPGLKTGYLIPRQVGSVPGVFLMRSSDIYTGEYSAIAENDMPTIHITAI